MAYLYTGYDQADDQAEGDIEDPATGARPVITDGAIIDQPDQGTIILPDGTPAPTPPAPPAVPPVKPGDEYDEPPFSGYLR